MAQRPGDQRLIETIAKTASAGWVPALAVWVVIAFAGCGGGSSDSASTGATTSASAAHGTHATREEDVPAGKKTSGKTSSSSSETPTGVEGSSGSASGGAPKGGHGQEQKRGPHISQPKGAKEPHITTSQRQEATVASMSLQSPALTPGAGSIAPLPARYTCDGENTWPTLTWSGIPSDTVELALFAMNVQPVDGKLFFDWAVAGLDPNLREMQPGKLPRGAIVGRNSLGQTGYSICPASTGEIYMFALYALPQRLSPSQGFEPHEFRKAVLQVSGNVGFLPASYARG